jgi:hypothetical protein
MLKVAIVTGSQYRSPLFLAEGLVRMLSRLGISSRVFPQGMSWLNAIKTPTGGIGGQIKMAVAKTRMRQLEEFDVIVVAGTVGVLKDLELFGPLLAMNKPVLHYQVFYLGGSPHWLGRVSARALDAFDGFLGVSGIHDAEPIQPEKFFHIGMDVLPQCAFEAKRDFVALLDFDRPDYAEERALHQHVLKQLKVPTIELNGEYSFKEIEAVYNKVALNFVAFPESFGVPVSQLQFYGSVVAAPSKMWVKRHAILPTHSIFSDDGSAPFSGNFLFYENEQDLIDRILDLRNRYAASHVRGDALRAQPHFFQGRLEALWNAFTRYV